MLTLLEYIKAHPAGGILSKSLSVAGEFLGATAKSYGPGAVLCHQGAEEDRVFFVKSGWGLLYRGLPNGERQILDTPLRGDLVGFRSAQGPRFASLASATELSVFEIPKKNLTEAMQNDGALGVKIACVLARQNAILAEHLVNAGRRDAQTKLAHLLLELEDRLSTVGIASPGSYECPLTQHELADILGMTTVHVNRILSEFRKSDLIYFRHGHVDMIDRTKLIKIAGFDREYLR